MEKKKIRKKKEINELYKKVQICASNSDFNEALDLLNQLISFFNNSDENDHINLAVIFNNIGLIQKYSKKYQEATEHYLKSLNLFQHLSLDNLQIEAQIEILWNQILTIQNFAICSVDMNNSVQGLELYKNVYEILKHVLELCAHQKMLDDEPNHSSSTQHWNILATKTSAFVMYQMALLWNSSSPKTYSSSSKSISCGDSNEALFCYETSLRLYERCMVLLQEQCEDELLQLNAELQVSEADLARVHSDFASFHFTRSNFSKAYDSWMEALKLLKVYEESGKGGMGEKPPEWVRVLNNIAVLYESVGQLDDAMRVHSEILNIRKSRLEPEHPDIANTLNNIGNIYLQRGYLNEASDNFTEALTIFRNLLDNFHPHVGGTLFNLGCVNLKDGQYDQALVQLEESLLIRRSSLGDAHIEVGSTYYAIGEVYRYKGLHDQAMVFYIRSKKVFEQNSLDSQHPKMQATLESIASIDDDGSTSSEEFDITVGDTFDSGVSPSYSKGRTSYAPSDGSSPLSSSALSKSFSSGGPVRTKKKSHRRSISDAKSEVSSKSGQTSKSYQTIATSASKAQISAKLTELVNTLNDRNDRSMKAYIDQLVKLRRRHGIAHPDVSTALVGIGDIYYERGDSLKAINAYDQAVQLQKINPDGDGTVEIAATIIKLGDSHVKHGQYEIGIEYFKYALNIYKELGLEENDHHVAQAVRRIDGAVDEEQRCF